MKILHTCFLHSRRPARLFILEDVLTDELNPPEAVMHGLRLAMYCSGGRQRCLSEFSALLFAANFTLEKAIRLDPVHTLLSAVTCF